MLETNTTPKLWALSETEFAQIWLRASREVGSLLKASMSQDRTINQRNNVIESLNKEIEQLDVSRQYSMLQRCSLQGGAISHIRVRENDNMTDTTPD